MNEKGVVVNRDGTVTVTVEIPPTPEWATAIDSAWNRMQDFCKPTSRWHFVSLSVPGYSLGYIVVLEKKGQTHSMSGAANLEAVAAGFGNNVIAALDDAVDRAKAWG